MAYVPQQIPDEEKNQFAPNAPTTSNPEPPQSGGSVGGGDSGGGPSGGKVPNVGSSTQFGSNAAKLSDYLKVNQPQIENWGNKIAGNLTQNYNQTMNDVNQGIGSFNQQVKQGIPQGDSNFVSQAASNPTDFVKNPENISKFQEIYQGNYKGPQNIDSTEPYQSLNNEVNTAVQNAGLVKNPSGLGAYLNTQMGGGYQETPGMQSLDTALLRGNPGAQKAISNAAKPYQNLQGYLSGQTQQANTNATNARNTVTQNAAQYQKQFTGQGGVIPTFQNDLTTRLGAASNSAGAAANQAKADLLAGKVTPEDMKILGIQPGQLNELSSAMSGLQSDYGQNFDLGNYATMQDPSAVFSSPNSIATADDYAKAAALSQLTGSDFGSYLDQSLAGNAGKQNNSLLSFNASGAKGDVSNLLKSNDTDTLNKALAPWNSAGTPKTLANLSDPGIVASIRAQLKGTPEAKKFEDALFRYQTQWQPTPGAPTPGTPPVIVKPGTGTRPIDNFLGINQGGGRGVY